MASALAFQAWLSVAKPGGKTPFGRGAVVRPTAAPAGICIAAAAALIVDIPLGLAMIPLIQNPAPVLASVVLLVALVSRTRHHRAQRLRSVGTCVAVIVSRAERVTPEVRALELTPVPPAVAAAWEPGAHVDLCLPSGLIRQYSLLGPLGDGRYRVVVLREPEGRGGSREVHGLTLGQQLAVRGPRNHFPLVPAPGYLFIAGGIGIVPLLAMIERVDATGQPWALLYRGRTLAHMPYAEDLRHRLGDRVTLAPADATPRPDLAALLQAQSTGTAVYCCGPDSLMAALEQLMPTACPTGTLHLEKFTPTDRSDLVNTAFEITLAYTRQTVPVPADASALDALRAALPDLPASCETGLCGTCRMSVLAGRPDHRDDILGSAERNRTDLFYPCVSRALDPTIVVDA